jgi:hypothetical protein
MLQSMFNLDHHIAELRPTSDEQRLARLREAAAPVARITRTFGAAARDRVASVTIGTKHSRIAA